MPANEILADEAARVPLADDFKNSITVQRRSAAAAVRLQVGGQAGYGSEAVAAVGTVDALAAVDTRVEVL